MRPKYLSPKHVLFDQTHGEQCAHYVHTYVNGLCDPNCIIIYIYIYILVANKENVNLSLRALI